MIQGAVIGESLPPGKTLEGIPLLIRKLYRFTPPNVTPEQPPVWTVIEFEATEDQADALGNALAEILDRGWYCDFVSAQERFVAFPGRFFRYLRGDAARRAEAQAYGRSVGVPDAQLQWSE